MKTPEEFNALKEEFETLNKKLAELTDEELVQVTGGSLADSLKKLQDGMKIDSGTDDSGGYQIDEKTREMIRQGIDPYQ